MVISIRENQNLVRRDTTKRLYYKVFIPKATYSVKFWVDKVSIKQVATQRLALQVVTTVAYSKITNVRR